MEKIHKSVYAYMKLQDGERQYDDVDFNESLYVDARYAKSPVATDVGNKFIEALPRYRSDDEILRDYAKDILSYDMQREMSRPRAERKQMVSQLRQLRFPLPFHKELEYCLYDALVSSYRVRYELIDENISIPAIIEDKEERLPGKLLGDSAGAANAGFALLGCSGCGKSSALNIALSNYPQVIMHHNAAFRRQVQIVYLVVNCIGNSNFAALYTGIGDAIDRALGITVGCYAKLIASKRNLGEKAEKVRELIEIFAVGIIIFDEIQLIDFASTKENSFEALLTLTNRTKVAIAVVGTEDAYGKMFRELRTARRIGNTIFGSNYCDNKAFFEMLVKRLFSYQWFDVPVAVTPELIAALYEYTHGIIDQLIGIYMFMNIDYLSARGSPTVNPAFVAATSEKHYRGVRALLKNYEDTYNELERQKIAAQAQAELQKLLSAGTQMAFADKIAAEERESGLEHRIQKKNVIRNIQMVTDDYSIEAISDCTDKVLNLAANRDATESAITRQVLARLQKKGTPHRKRVPQKLKLDHEAMAKYLLE